MPVQVVPPMYRMLSNEVKWAIDDVRTTDFHAVLALMQIVRMNLMCFLTSYSSLGHIILHPMKSQPCTTLLCLQNHHRRNQNDRKLRWRISLPSSCHKMEYTLSTPKMNASNRCAILLNQSAFRTLHGCFFQFAIHTADYAFTTATEPREKDSFGLDTRGRMMLVPADRFPQLVDKISEVYAVG